MYPFYSKTKYHNKKTKIDDMIFDSKKEALRYKELKILEKSGLISDLKTQVRFLICPKSRENKRERFYIADFTYTENGKTVIEDVKSKATLKDKVFSLKWALMQWQYPEYEYKILD